VPLHVASVPAGAGHALHEVPQLVAAVLPTHWSPHRCELDGQLHVSLQLQFSPQVCVPVPPQDRVAPGLQDFSPVHADQSPY
jgi:hypothetical protein